MGQKKNQGTFRIDKKCVINLGRGFLGDLKKIINLTYKFKI